VFCRGNSCPRNEGNAILTNSVKYTLQYYREGWRLWQRDRIYPLLLRSWTVMDARRLNGAGSPPLKSSVCVNRETWSCQLINPRPHYSFDVPWPCLLFTYSVLVVKGRQQLHILCIYCMVAPTYLSSVILVSRIYTFAPDPPCSVTSGGVRVTIAAPIKINHDRKWCHCSVVMVLVLSFMSLASRNSIMLFIVGRMVIGLSNDWQQTFG
jgi:hypothetical protein